MLFIWANVLTPSTHPFGFEGHSAKQQCQPINVFLSNSHPQINPCRRIWGCNKTLLRLAQLSVTKLKHHHIRGHNDEIEQEATSLPFLISGHLKTFDWLKSVTKSNEMADSDVLPTYNNWGGAASSTTNHKRSEAYQTLLKWSGVKPRGWDRYQENVTHGQ